MFKKKLFLQASDDDSDEDVCFEPKKATKPKKPSAKELQKDQMMKELEKKSREFFAKMNEKKTKVKSLSLKNMSQTQKCAMSLGKYCL